MIFLPHFWHVICKENGCGSTQHLSITPAFTGVGCVLCSPPQAAELALLCDISKLDCTGLKIDPFRNRWTQGCGVGVWSRSRWSRMFSAGVGVGSRSRFSKLLESESGVGVGFLNLVESESGIGVGFSKLLESESGVWVGTFVAITDSNVY